MSEATSVANAENRRRPSRRKLFSTDHRAIGLRYLWISFAAVLIGLTLSVVMRLHLVYPDLRFPFIGEVKPEDYLGVMTMHATFMVFFVLSIAPQNAFANYLLPLQIGAREMVFPKLNAAGLWTTWFSFAVMVAAMLAPGGAPSAGWTSYAPLSAVPSAAPGLDRGMDLWLISIGIFCIASVMSATNIIVTTLRARAAGLSMMRLPLTVWTWFVTALMTITAFAPLFAAVIMLYMDRRFGTSFFVPQVVVNGVVQRHQGGSPLLWQHLFWFFGHPEVYISILPGMGIVSTVLATFSRKPLFGYKAMVYATIAIGIFGMGIWGHHMFLSGMDPHAVSAFSLMTMAVAVPSSIKTVNWLGTIWRGRLHFTAPMLFALGFISLFVTGGLTGPVLAQPRLNEYLHDTYFVVAHFHMIMAMAAGFAVFAGLYFWYPRFFGRMMDERLGALHFWLSFVGAYATFLPMHLLGLAGHPRRYSELAQSSNLVQQLIPLQRFITVAAVITAAAQLIFFFNFFWSLRRGRLAAENPWRATTLEWAPEGSALATERPPYDFSPGAAQDFTPQWLAAAEQPHQT